MEKELNIIDNTSRRSFLKNSCSLIAGITVIGGIAPVLEGCYNSSNPTAATGSSSDAGHTMTVDVSSLTTDNTALHAQAPVSKRELLIVRRSATLFETILLVCKHQGSVYPVIDIKGQTIYCSNHGSTYDLDGHVIQGPATSNLDTFATTFNASAKTVMISF